MEVFIGWYCLSCGDKVFSTFFTETPGVLTENVCIHDLPNEIEELLGDLRSATPFLDRVRQMDQEEGQ